MYGLSATNPIGLHVQVDKSLEIYDKRVRSSEAQRSNRTEGRATQIFLMSLTKSFCFHDKSIKAP